MIFVTLGTHELSFTRILEYLEKSNIDEEVIIQSGNTKFKSKKYEIVPFMSSEQFDFYMRSCDLVICHGGVGSILTALKQHKKVITVPRLAKFNEHNDNHQLEIVEKLHRKNYIINCNTYEEFYLALKSYENKNLKKYKFSNFELVNYIDNYIKSL